MKLCDIESRITAESDIDPDKTAMLILHAGSHEWSTSRASDTIVTADHVYKQYTGIIENMGDKFTHTEFVISGIPPRKPARANGQRITEINSEINELNDRLEEYCSQNGYLTFVDHRPLISPGSEIDQSLFLNSVELNKKGKQLILQNIFDKIPYALSRWGKRNSDLLDT